MDSKKLAIIVIIVVAIVAVAAAVVLMNQGGKSIPSEVNEYGLVYGNADGDTKLDQTDIDIIDAVIKDQSLLSKYPLADTNYDGKVTEADKEMLQKMIKKEKMTVHVIQFDDQDKITVVESNYPLTKIVASGGTNMRVLIAVLDLHTVMVGNATNKYISPVLDKDLYDLRESGKILILNTSPKDDDRTKLAAADFDAIITEISGREGYGADSYRSLYKEKGATFMQFSVDNTKECLQAIATMGILVGQESNAKAFIDFSQKVEDTIKTKEGNKFGTATIMNVVMSNSVSGTTSDYHKATIAAGGNNLADFAQTTKKFPDGSDNTWLLDPKYNPQYLIHISSTVFGDSPTTSTVNAIKKNFSETAAYKADQYYLINGTIPLPVRLAYMAEIMYEDCFDKGWCVSVLQDYMDQFTSSKVDVKDYKILWTTEELKNF